MFDLLDEDPAPHQAPTLTELEEARAYGAMARRRSVEWLMAEDGTDVEVLLAQLVSRPAWHQRAACKGVGPDLFFPPRSDGRPVQGLAYCEQCPVRQECLASAQELATTNGVWGGTTGRQRRTMRRGVA